MKDFINRVLIFIKNLIPHIKSKFILNILLYFFLTIRFIRDFYKSKENRKEVIYHIFASIIDLIANIYLIFKRGLGHILYFIKLILRPYINIYIGVQNLFKKVYSYLSNYKHHANGIPLRVLLFPSAFPSDFFRRILNFDLKTVTSIFIEGLVNLLVGYSHLVTGCFLLYLYYIFLFSSEHPLSLTYDVDWYESPGDFFYYMGSGKFYTIISTFSFIFFFYVYRKRFSKLRRLRRYVKFYIKREIKLLYNFFKKKK